MREILFRAKQVNNGEWVEGYFAIGKWYLDEKERYAILPIDLCFYPHCEINEWIEIDPETVCQYTGLKDKNGNRIWENDIVLLREEIQEYEWKAMVKFGNSNWEYNWGWQLVPIGECDMNRDILLWIDMEIANCEVIGNIFDDKHLLDKTDYRREQETEDSHEE